MPTVRRSLASAAAGSITAATTASRRVSASRVIPPGPKVYMQTVSSATAACPFAYPELKEQHAQDSHSSGLRSGRVPALSAVALGSSVHGTNGKDRIRGTNGKDRINARAGNDRVKARGG